MKKTFFMIGLAAAALLGATACDNCKTSKVVDTRSGDKDVLYSGILPSADAQGTVYVLKLEFDNDHNHTDGDYTMVETSLVSDTAAVSGLKEMATAYTKGDFRKASKQVGGQTVEYITLTPDVKDGLGAASTTPVYFVVNADESLTMVNSDLEMPSMPSLYTLSVQQ